MNDLEIAQKWWAALSRDKKGEVIQNYPIPYIDMRNINCLGAAEIQDLWSRAGRPLTISFL